MNIKPSTCRCGASPQIDDTSPDGTVVFCPSCGLSFEGPNTFVATIAWNRMISSYQTNIKELEPSEDNE